MKLSYGTNLDGSTNHGLSSFGMSLAYCKLMKDYVIPAARKLYSGPDIGIGQGWQKLWVYYCDSFYLRSNSDL